MGRVDFEKVSKWKPSKRYLRSKQLKIDMFVKVIKIFEIFKDCISLLQRDLDLEIMDMEKELKKNAD